MLAAYAQIGRVQAHRMLDAAQAAAYPHLTSRGASGWLNGLIERVRGVVTATHEAAGEALHWNGKVVDLRTFRRDWERHESESARPNVRESGRAIVNRLMGRGR